MKKVIIFLVRKGLRLKRYESFKFSNQKTEAIYYFTDKNLMKRENGHTTFSSVSLNWLLNKNCKIEKIGMITKTDCENN